MHPAFEVLGIAPDADQRAIKRAYAAKLKDARPDEDPTGFQRLNEAYRDALCWIEYRDDAWNEDEFSGDTDDDSDGTPDETEHAATEDAEWPGFRVSVSGPALATLPVFAASFSPTASPAVAPAWQSESAPETDDTSQNRTAASTEIHVDRVDFDALLDDALRAAFDRDPKRIREWLNEEPLLWSLQHKTRIGHWLLQSLDERLPPLPGHNFDTIAFFFGYYDLHSGYDPMRLRELRQRLDEIWEQERVRFASPGAAIVVQPSAPAPWSAEASRRRAAEETERREEHERKRLEDIEQQRQRTILRVHPEITRERQLIRDYWRASAPYYGQQLRAFLNRKGYGDAETLPPNIRSDALDFWLRASDDHAWSWPRAKLAFARSLIGACIFAPIIWVIASFQNDGNYPLLRTVYFFFGAVVVLLGLWSIVASAKSILIWQGSPDPPRGWRRWGHRAFPVALSSASIAFWIADGFATLSLYLGLIACFVGFIRFRMHQDLKRARANAGRLPEDMGVFFVFCVILLPFFLPTDAVATGALFAMWAASLGVFMLDLRDHRGLEQGRAR
jgi:hypothetical protein